MGHTPGQNQLVLMGDVSKKNVYLAYTEPLWTV